MKDEEIQAILDHPVYSQFTSGQERINGILDELLDAGEVSEERHKELYNASIKLDTVEDVRNAIADTQETE